MKIISPVTTGNGAYVVHKNLERTIKNYHVCSYNPWWTVLPIILPHVCQLKKADIIHTTPDYGLFFSKPNIPLILTWHNYILDAFMRRYSGSIQRLHYATDLKWFTQISLQRATKMTSVSLFTANLVRQDLNYQAEIKVIYNGVDTSQFTPRKKPMKKALKVLFAGNLTRRKGVDLLPKIATRVQSHIRILYTSGLRTQKILSESPILKNLGYIPYENMPALYQEVDILLFPTVREGFALVVLEAMACGLPVIATNCSSLPEIVINGKGGFLCELGHADDFAEKINLLANSPKLCLEMGEFNRARVETLFTETRMMVEYQRLFEEVMDTK